MTNIRDMYEYFMRAIGRRRDPREARYIMQEYQYAMQREFGYSGRSPMAGGVPWRVRANPPPTLPSMFASATNELSRPAKPKPPLPEEHVVSALVGYRAWNVPLFVDELRSVNQQAKWKPFERYEAVCAAAQCGGVSCSCGIYAFNKMSLVQGEYKQEDRSERYVYGECWLWGRVLECKDGYRAQFAYPKAFINNGAIAKRMAEVFGVRLLATSNPDVR